MKPLVKLINSWRGAMGDDWLALWVPIWIACFFFGYWLGDKL